MAEKEKRLVQHNFRTTESEARIMRKKMDALGITNESAYMRALALNGYILKLDLPQIREMIRLLSNMTNNLNQIARVANSHPEALPDVQALRRIFDLLSCRLQDWRV